MVIALLVQRKRINSMSNLYYDTFILINQSKFYLGRLQVQIEQDLSSNYISGIHLIKKSVEQFIRSVVA